MTSIRVRFSFLFEEEFLHNMFPCFVTDLYKAINPFIKRVPIDEQEDFVDEIAERLLVKYKEQKYDTDTFVASTRTIVIHAKK